MFRMASVSLYVGSENRVSRVQRVSSVGVTDVSSLTGISIGAEVVLLLAASVGLFVPGQIVLAFLFLLVLFHRWCKKAS